MNTNAMLACNARALESTSPAATQGRSDSCIQKKGLDAIEMTNTKHGTRQRLGFMPGFGSRGRP
jgi:hypothetical protein